jgi:hypothetical protein
LGTDGFQWIHDERIAGPAGGAEAGGSRPRERRRHHGGIAMRFSKIGGLVLSAACMAGIATAGGAAAAVPELGRCVKLVKPYDGGFTNANCTRTSASHTGKYDWLPGAAKVALTGAGGRMVIETVDRIGVGCGTASSTGEYAGPQQIRNLVLHFRNCFLSAYQCRTAGLRAGEVDTNVLEGRFVWEDEAEKKVALDLFPAEGRETLMELDCSDALAIVEGSVLVPVKANKMSETLALKFKETHGLQKPPFYEEGGEELQDVLLTNIAGKGFKQSGMSLTMTITGEEGLEVNSDL